MLRLTLVVVGRAFDHVHLAIGLRRCVVDEPRVAGWSGIVGAVLDHQMHVIKGATHYYKGQPKQLAEALSITTGWMTNKNLRD